MTSVHTAVLTSHYSQAVYRGTEHAWPSLCVLTITLGVLLYAIIPVLLLYHGEPCSNQNPRHTQ